ncbi:TPA: hypothetical protein G8V68_000767 [Salmonella enterica]|nr:hypothetical protein [Salmonella enterica]
MRYRREDENGDYTFGRGDSGFFVDCPEAVAQAVKTRLQLWQGQWFLDANEGTPYEQTIIGKQVSEVYVLAVRDRVLSTPGVNNILSMTTTTDDNQRRVNYRVTLDTIYGEGNVNV